MTSHNEDNRPEAILDRVLEKSGVVPSTHNEAQKTNELEGKIITLLQPLYNDENYDLEDSKYGAVQFREAVQGVLFLLTTRDQQHKKEMEEKLDGLVETLADIEHERWSKWQRYLHSKLDFNGIDYVLKEEWFERWNRQIHTPYCNLSGEEQESDREQVRPYLKIIKEALTPHPDVPPNQQTP